MKTYSFKNLITAVFLLAPAFLFTSCEEVVLRGHGDTVTRTRPVGSFDRIDVSGEFEVYLTQGPAQDIELEGQPNVLDELSTQVRDNRLIIKYDTRRVRVNVKPKLYITTPNLTDISLSGSNTVRGVNDWQVDDFEIDASGSSKLYLTLKDADEIKSKSSGSTDVTLNGDANSYEQIISGSGNIKAFGLSAKTANISVSGSGRCELTVTQKLDSKISGSGKIRYKGTPGMVSTSISGSGSVAKVD